jgi:hypothetical protein
MRSFDCAYRQIAEDREGIGRKRLPPLFAMLGIAPAWSVRLDERFGAFGEGHAAPLRCQGRPALRKRVLAGRQQRALRRRPLPCLGQRDRAGGAEAQLAAPTLPLVAEYPALRAALAHLQVQAAAVTVVPRLKCPPADQNCRELVNRPRHLPVFLPMSHEPMYTNVDGQANTVSYAMYCEHSRFQDTGGPSRTPAYVGTGDTPSANIW